MFCKIYKMLLICFALVMVLCVTNRPVSAAGGEKLLGSISWKNKGAANVSDFLNIRKSASADSDIVAVLKPGRVVTITGSDGDWSKVKSGKYTGYVMTKYLATKNEARKLYISKVGAQGKVTASSLTIRAKASKESDKITSVPQGTKLSLKSLSGGWYKVSYQGATGYVLGTYIKECQPLTAVSEAEYNKSVKTADSSSTAKSTKKSATKKSSKKTSTKKKAASKKKADDGYVISCTEEEVDMLAAIVACEAGNEPDKGKLAVAAVVVNRVQSSDFPDSIESVIKQKGQFSPVKSGSFAKRLKKGASSSCYEAAEKALNGSSPVGDAVSFRAGHSSKGTQIGNQYFF